MATETMWTWQDLMAENKISADELPEKTRNLIKKFNEEADEDKLDALDEKIFNDVDDFIEEREKNKTAQEKKIKRDATKKKIDVSKAATAAAESGDGKKVKKTPENGSGFYGRHFNRG